MASTPQAEQHLTSTPPSSSHRKHTRDEMLAIFRAARAEVQTANPGNRDLLAELIQERRAASEHD